MLSLPHPGRTQRPSKTPCGLYTLFPYLYKERDIGRDRVIEAGFAAGSVALLPGGTHGGPRWGRRDSVFERLLSAWREHV